MPRPQEGPDRPRGGGGDISNICKHKPVCKDWVQHLDRSKDDDR